MGAFGLTIAFVMFFWFVGYALLRVFPTGNKRSADVLFAPAVGVGITVLLVFLINRIGYPVKSFAWVIAALLLLLAALSYRWNGFAVSWKRILFVFGLAIIVLLASAWPMLWFSFDWIGVGNDDMANYCLAAQRFFNVGFFNKPDIEAIQAGTNYADTFYFMHVAGGARPGSELLLAWAWGVTGIEAPRVFMPLISALNVCLALACGGLVATHRASNNAWIYAVLLSALNPLLTWGVGQQLIGQVGGFVFVVTLVGLLFTKREIPQIRKPSTLYQLIPTIIVAASMLVWYPEGVPFVVGGWIVFVGFGIFYGHIKLRDVYWIVYLAIGTVAVLPEYFFKSVIFLLAQAAAVQANGLIPDPAGLLFPYYLIPSGLAAFWGLHPVHNGVPSEPFASILFVIACLLFVILGLAVKRGLTTLDKSAPVLVVMAILGVRLYQTMNDFGLYKLAMYAQPFIISMFALYLSKVCWNLYKKAALLIFISITANTSFAYSYRSSGEAPGSSIEIQNGSSRKFLTELKGLFQNRADLRGRDIIATTDNVVIAKLVAFYGNGFRVLFPARDYFGGITSYAEALKRDTSQPTDETLESKNYVGVNTKLGDMDISFYEPYRLSESYQNKPLYLSFCNTSVVSDNCDRLLKVTDSFEGSIFVHSNKGAHYYSGNRKNAAFFQNETDIFPPGMFASMGRYLLLQTPSQNKSSKFLIDITATLQKKRGSTLPTVLLNGDQDHKIQADFVGRGSGRLYVDKLPTTQIMGNQYTLIDFNVPVESFPNKWTLPSFLYGNDILVDMRKIAVFGRALRSVSIDDYNKLIPPAKVSSFPADLKNVALEYSGIYEDGWMSEQLFFKLKRDEKDAYLEVAGSTPYVDDKTFQTTITVKLNGQEVASKKLGLGDFQIDVPVHSRNEISKVEVSFDSTQILPGADGRITAGFLKFVGFKEKQI